MGIFYEEFWKCKNCGYEITLMHGLYEADPGDFGTTHHVVPYYCPKCNAVKDVSRCISIDEPEPQNKRLILNESDICEHCGTKMKFLEKNLFLFFRKKYKCPKCGKKHFRFISQLECMT